MDSEKIVFYDKIRGDKQAFIDRLQKVSAFLKADINHLMAVMYSESKLDPKATNPYTGAVGLLQFMPATLKDLGVTTSYILGLSAVDQLEYVQEYFKRFKGKLNSYYDVYLAVFFPAAIGKPDSFVFETKTLSASLIAKQNHSLDFNNDGKITIAEFKQYLKNTIPSSLQKIVFAAKKTLPLIIVLIFAGLLFIKK